MSVYVSAAVWKNYPGSGGNGLVVLLALADQADDDGWCYPSVAYIAGKCRLSERAVQDNLARLETMGPTGGHVPPGHGLLERHPRPGRSTYYRVRTDRMGGPAAGGAKPAPVRPAAPGGAETRDEGVRGAAPITIKEPSPTPLAEPSSTDEGAGGALPGMPEPPMVWSAGSVVAAWCRGYAETHDGRQPPASVLARVRGSARAAADCLEEDRAAVLEVAAAAGALVRYDVVSAIADAAAGRLRGLGTATASPDSRNAAILARAAARHDERGSHDRK